jgi:hypothetical protein
MATALGHVRRHVVAVTQVVATILPMKLTELTTARTGYRAKFQDELPLLANSSLDISVVAS